MDTGCFLTDLLVIFGNAWYLFGIVAPNTDLGPLNVSLTVITKSVFFKDGSMLKLRQSEDLSVRGTTVKFSESQS